MFRKRSDNTPAPLPAVSEVALIESTIDVSGLEQDGKGRTCSKSTESRDTSSECLGTASKGDSYLSGELGTRKSFHSRTLGEKEKTGLQITMWNVKYTVPDRKPEKGGSKEKILLGGFQRLTGNIDPGNMVALMGSSGAGKTTLLDIICKRKTVGKLEGDIVYDGQVPSAQEIKRDTGYVEQFETLWEVFTVYEMLLYTAMLHMPSSKYTQKQKEARVLEVLDQLGLRKVKDTKIGGMMSRGISGGEARRVSVGIGLLNNPRALFFDEPTTGLDSATAFDVMGLIRELAQEGRTVLATIHQPSGQIFDFFTTVILLSRDTETKSGNIVYFGPGKEAIKHYFTTLGFTYDEAIYDNIPEYFTDIVGGGVSGPSEGNSLIEAYEASDLREDAHHAANGIVKVMEERKKSGKGSTRTLGKKSVYANGFFEETWTLIKFKGKAEFTDLFFLLSRIALFIVAALLLDSMYAGQTNSPQGVIVVANVFHIMVLIQGFITIMYVPNLIISRPVFVRETYDGLYRVASYCAARLVIECTAMLIAIIGYSCTLYWAIQGVIRQEAGAFFFFMLAMYIFSIAAMTTTFAISAPFPAIEVATSAVAIYMLLNVAVLGFLNAVPPIWGWFSYLSIMRWGWSAFMINNFKGQEVDICGDVNNALTTTQLVNGLEQFTSVESIFTNSNNTQNLDINTVLCGVLNTAFNEQDQFLSQTCPQVPILFNPSTMASPALNCSSQLISVVENRNAITEEDLAKSAGNLILAAYPMGDGYDAHRKLINYSKWECLGYLVIIWIGFVFLFYFNTILSLKLVKR